MRPELPCDIEDRYTVVAELGRGSHAIVYQAHDRVLGRDVAIKVLREELVDSQVSERFRREIRLTSQLDHPHIAHVYGTGEWRGSPYFVIALARGPSLADRLLREKQLPVDDALAITRDVAAALSHAHQAGIVHRDVKPANILLTPDGALLTDFGVARAVEASLATLATSTGTAVGTLLYMSPEQLCAEKDIDARSDQYALALVLYEMLAGVSAHTAANAEGLRALRIVGQHAPLRTHRPSVSLGVDGAIDRALSPTPADRFSSMAEFVAAIDGTTVSNAWRVSAAHRTTAAGETDAPRRVWIRSTAVAGALLLIGVSATALWRPGDADVAMTREALAGASSFSIHVVGDTTQGAPVARQFAEELRAWTGISADVGAAEGVPLDVRVTTIPEGLSASVAVSPSRRVRVQLDGVGVADADSMRLLAARVLMATAVSPDSAETLTTVGDRNTTAIRLYGEAWRSLLDGRTDDAESRFAEAGRTGAVPQATLWQAIVGSWSQPKTPSAWRDAARSAASRRLSAADSTLAAALVARATNDMPRACESYGAATRIGSGSFAAWYGLGECLQTDSTVLRDNASPTGYRFQTSYWAALMAYGKAIERLPSDRMVRLFNRLPRVALAENPAQRTGMLMGGGAMQGLPATEGDSVVVHPLPVDRMQGGGTGTIPATYQSAVRRARRRLLDLSSALAERAPRSLDAQLGLARALEYAGVLNDAGAGASAISVLRQASTLALTAADSMRVGLAEARVMLRTGEFSGVRRVADRLLADVDSTAPAEARPLLSLAIIADRRDAVERLYLRVNAVSARQPDALPVPTATAIAAYAEAAIRGACSELPSLRSAAMQSVSVAFSPVEVGGVTERYLEPVEWVAMSCPDSPVPASVPASDPTIRAFMALRGRRYAEVQNLLRMMTAQRRGVAATSVAWDTRFGETWLAVQSGDSGGARARLAAAFDDLPATMDFVLYDPRQGAGLRRSLQLCEALDWPVDQRAVGDRCRNALSALGAGRTSAP